MGVAPESVRAPDAWLTEVERERAARFLREQDRASFVAAHLLVRLAAAAYLGADPGGLTLVQHCPTHGPGHGKPSILEVPGLGVSLSHTRGYVAAAAGPGRVGVDAERIKEGPLDRMLAEHVGAGPDVTDNTALIRLWALKEAMIKRGELTLDRMRERHEPGGHVLEWAEPDGVIVVAVTDVRAERMAV
ncbi:phosphopantetheinyl transferase-like protein [Nonomuraea longicatena]|uniref:Phosphopantetheinyl transferase n=1 Tax=Nonomuraea longicatena TaxID=83682 RepID=A0ABN1P7R4_9ACTN